MTDEERTAGFRPAARRRNRIAAGVALGAVAIGLNVLVYASLDDTEPVVQAVRDIPAGSLITDDMLRTVEVDVDDSVAAVPGDRLDLVVGQYAKVRIVSGSLVVSPAVQSEPLVSVGGAVLAIEVTEGALPVGLRERSQLRLVLADGVGTDRAPTVVEARAVGLPTRPESSIGTMSLTVEVPAADAPAVAVADTVRVVLVEPTPDPAADAGIDVATATDTSGADGGRTDGDGADAGGVAEIEGDAPAAEQD